MLPENARHFHITNRATDCMPLPMSVVVVVVVVVIDLHLVSLNVIAPN